MALACATGAVAVAAAGAALYDQQDRARLRPSYERTVTESSSRDRADLARRAVVDVLFPLSVL